MEPTFSACSKSLEAGPSSVLFACALSSFLLHVVHVISLLPEAFHFLLAIGASTSFFLNFVSVSTYFGSEIYKAQYWCIITLGIMLTAVNNLPSS
jgi:hypothetical protein